MFTKVLYPTDFSDVAVKALDYIKQLKEAGTEEVILLHVIDQRSIDVLNEFARTGSTEKGLEDYSKKEITDLSEKIRSWGLRPTTRIVQGLPLPEILNASEEDGISLIVIGSHGKSNIAEMLMGSVSEKVVRKSKRPVLVVKR